MYVTKMLIFALDMKEQANSQEDQTLHYRLVSEKLLCKYLLFFLPELQPHPIGVGIKIIKKFSFFLSF